MLKTCVYCVYFNRDQVGANFLCYRQVTNKMYNYSVLNTAKNEVKLIEEIFYFYFNNMDQPLLMLAFKPSQKP